MPNIVVFTNPLAPGNAQLPVFTVGDDQNWSLQFNDGSNFYNPTGVSMNIGFVRGLGNLTFNSGFQWVDRMNNQHTGSFAIAAGVPGSLTWDESPINVAGDYGAWLLRGRTPPSGSIRKVYVKYGGAAFSKAPAIRFNGGASTTGKGATATVGLTAGVITSFAITNPGTGYSSSNPPEVIVTDSTGSGAQLNILTVTNGRCTTTGASGAGNIVLGGSGYTAPVVTIVDPEATATVSGTSSSGLTGLTLTSGGAGYTSAPSIAITGGGGASATASATLANSTWGLSNLVGTNGGVYNASPTISFSGGTGSGATGSVSWNAPGTVVQAMVVSPTDHGYGYGGVPPTVIFSGGGGSGATGIAILDTNYAGPGLVGIYVVGIQITNPGSGYTSPPTISFSATPSGQPGAAAFAILGNGAVNGLSLTNPGSGYGATAPTVVFTGTPASNYPIQGFTITDGGSGYDSTNLSRPAVTITGGGGSGATAEAVIGANGKVTAIYVTNPGSGYSSLPTVAIAPGSGTATATAVLVGSTTATATVGLIGSPVGSVAVTAAGSGYTSLPLAGFSGGVGSGAAATCVLSLGLTAVTVVQGGYAYTTLPSISIIPDNGALLIPSGVESHSAPFIQNINPGSAQGAIAVTPYTNGRRDASGNLIYDDSLLIIRPRYLVQPTLALQPDGLTWAGVFTPVTTMVQAVLNYRRSFVADVEIFGGGRLLFAGPITIAAA